jgi:hypothetical protein
MVDQLKKWVEKRSEDSGWDKEAREGIELVWVIAWRNRTSPPLTTFRETVAIKNRPKNIRHLVQPDSMRGQNIETPWGVGLGRSPLDACSTWPLGLVMIYVYLHILIVPTFDLFLEVPKCLKVARVQFWRGHGLN